MRITRKKLSMVAVTGFLLVLTGCSSASEEDEVQSTSGKNSPAINSSGNVKITFGGSGNTDVPKGYNSPLIKANGDVEIFFIGEDFLKCRCLGAMVDGICEGNVSCDDEKADE